MEQVKFRNIYVCVNMPAITIRFLKKAMNLESKGVYGKVWETGREGKM